MRYPFNADDFGSHGEYDSRSVNVSKTPMDRHRKSMIATRIKSVSSPTYYDDIILMALPEYTTRAGRAVQYIRREAWLSTGLSNA